MRCTTALEAMPSFGLTDFREDLTTITVPHADVFNKALIDFFAR